MPETIVAAALQIEGLTLSLPRPAGHGEVIVVAQQTGLSGMGLQGFLTSDGRFVTRVEAMKIAHRADQPFREKPRGHELFSEDVW